MLLLLEVPGQDKTATALPLTLHENAVEVTDGESAKAQLDGHVIVGVVINGAVSIEQIEAARVSYPDLPIYVPFTGSPVFISNRYGRIYLDRNNLIIGRKKIHCSRLEALAMSLLIEAGGGVVSSGTILAAFGYVPQSKSHTHLTHMGRIRNKLSDCGIADLIVTKKNSKSNGYYLNSE